MTPIGHDRIAALIPHAGAMCLLDCVLDWSDGAIACRAISHLSATNPLRRENRLAAICGVEYGLQAAALHGALRDGATQQPGYLAAVRIGHLALGPWSDPALGDLVVRARREHGSSAGVVYELTIHAADGATLLAARATIALPG